MTDLATGTSVKTSRKSEVPRVWPMLPLATQRQLAEELARLLRRMTRKTSCMPEHEVKHEGGLGNDG